MKLVPVMTFPSLNTRFESTIARLAAGDSQDLNLKVTIPEEYAANYLILALKL